MQDTSIIQFSEPHSQAVARLHKEGIPTGFLSTCSDRFLEHLYKAIKSSPQSEVWVFINPNTGNVDGFIAGTTDINKMYRSILLRKSFLFLFLLLPQLRKAPIFRYIIETLLYPYKIRPHKRSDDSVVNIQGTSTVSKIKAELLSIVVGANSRKRGVGKKLIFTLDTWFLNKNIFNYKVVTASDNNNTNKFYESCGFVHARQFYHHGNLMNEYIRHLGPSAS